MTMSSITISAALNARAQKQAKREGVSLTRLVSQSIKDRLAGKQPGHLHPTPDASGDSFFTDNFVAEGGPTDVVENHDAYLMLVSDHKLKRAGNLKKPSGRRRKK